MYQHLHSKITLIDTCLFGQQVTACYLVEGDDQCAIIETGSFRTTERIMKVLNDRGIAPEQVRYVIPTHVHLDHAGGASSLIQAFPNASLVIHPNGARHMIDPSRLVAGTKAVYGERLFKEIYGTILPIDEKRIITVEDNDSLFIGSRKLLFRDTKGHANHHFCIWDELSSGWFTGDTFGVSYPQMVSPKGRFVFPTTTPVQFDPDALIASIQLLMSYQPKRMYLTHYGEIDVTQEMSELLCEQVQEYVKITLQQSEQQTTVEALEPLLNDYLVESLYEQGCTLERPELEKLIAMDITLNCQGLVVWKQRHHPQNTD